MKIKTRSIIIFSFIFILIFCACSSIFGNIEDNDPHHIVITCPGSSGEPETGFNPLTGWGCGHLNFNPLVQSTLFNSDEDGNITNDIAKNYSISSDGYIWTVNIRDDIKFSNNESLKASDVAFTFNTAKDSNSNLDLSNLENATAINDTTVIFYLKKPQSTFIHDLRYVGIVPEKNYNNMTYGENPIGSGPYKLQQWDKGQQAIFVYNENYYGHKPYFTQVTMLFPKDDAAFGLVKTHQADVVQAPFQSLNETEEGYDLIEIKSSRSQGISLPYLNDTGLKTAEGDSVGNNVTADKNIRLALNIGINRDYIVESVYKGHGEVECSGVDLQSYANNNSIIKDNNLSKAKKILDDGGWTDDDGDGIREKNGLKAIFKLYYPPKDQARQALAINIAEQANKLGIKIELVGADWDTIYQHMYSDAVVMQQSSENPYRTVYQQFHSKENLTTKSYMNPNAYNNSEVDSILDQAMESTDLYQANELWKKSSFISSNSGFGPNSDCPWLWVVDYDYCYFVKKDIDLVKKPKMGQDYLQYIVYWERK